LCASPWVGATEAHHVGSGPEEDRGCSTGKVGENQEAEEVT